MVGQTTLAFIGCAATATAAVIANEKAAKMAVLVTACAFALYLVGVLALSFWRPEIAAMKVSDLFELEMRRLGTKESGPTVDEPTRPTPPEAE
ncbi:MAG: hypothetical protein OXH75_02565 [Acidobacteria bacterium]|nr:hypothetical protein [Acidobacteriota bacterium]